MTDLTMVFLGGGLGSVSRYGIGLWAKKTWPGWPMGTLASQRISLFDPWDHNCVHR